MPDNDETRTYNSPLREERARETRERILEAATKILGEGAHKMTIPNVAKEAGVAVPTVYRYFSSKEELEENVVEYVKDSIGIVRPYKGLDGLEETLRRNWAASVPPGILPLHLATVARNLGGPPNERRREHIETGLAEELAKLSPEDRERFVRLVEAFASSVGRVALLRTGVTADEGADVLAWMFRTLHDALSKNDGT